MNLSTSISSAIRSGYRLFQRHSPPKQFLSNFVQRLSPVQRFFSGFAVGARAVSSAVVMLILSGTTSSVVLADIFRIDLPQLENGYQYGQSSVVVPINLGTPLLGLDSIQIELSGEHTAGWWEDMVFNYAGPLGGILSAGMDLTSPYSWDWSGEYSGGGNGPFTATITLHRNGGGSDWSFLRDGVTDLTLTHSELRGIGGGFTTPPSFNLTHVALVINATPMPVSQVDVASLLANAQATVTNTTIDIGPIGNAFDGNTNTLARTQSVNPMVVTLSFATPKQLIRSRVWFLAGSNRWRVETADSIADLDAASGTFHIALDWATDNDSAWRDRSFAAPITCRAVRLKLQRLTGDNYVHLNDWQLYVLDRPFVVTDLQSSGPNWQLTWNSSLNQWYEVYSSPDLTNWSSAGFQKGLENTTSLQVPSPPGDRGFFRVRKALPEDRPSITKRVLVLNIDPILEAQGGQRLHQYMGWNDPHDLNTAYLSDLSSASGGYVQWQLAAWVDLDLWPRKTDGFQYTDTTFLQSWFNSTQYPFHSPDSIDYDTLLDLPLTALNNKTAHQMAASGEVDEVICWAFPYSGFYESRMVGSTAYWCNSPGLVRSSRLYVVMGLNPERGVAEALHSCSHRGESILTHVYGSWSGTSTVNHLWDRFTRVGPKHGVSVAGCGNVHFPPNASNDYEYSVFTSVTSEANRWLAYPDFSGALASVNALTWGGPDYHRNFLIWWMTRFPKVQGRYVDPNNAINNGKLNNWWGYLFDMNEYSESR